MYAGEEHGGTMQSLGNFIAWWEMVRVDAEDAIARYEDGTIHLIRNGEDISDRAIRELRVISQNMDAFVSLAKREAGEAQAPPPNNPDAP
jgi:hypothetical protein